MAILFQSNFRFETDSGNNLFQNVPQACIFWKMMIPVGANPPGITGQNGILQKIIFDFVFQLMGSAGPTVILRSKLMNSAGTVTQTDLPLTQGSTYWLGANWDGTGTGLQTIIINGSYTKAGNYTGNTYNNNSQMQLGIYYPSPVTIIFDDLNMRSNYILTPADWQTLLAGGDPGTIGTTAQGATYRGRWPLGGTLGATPTIGQVGLKNMYANGSPLPGGDGSDFKTAIGTNTSKYVAPLVWAPVIDVKKAYISSSGQSFYCFFRSLIDNSDTFPCTLNFAPNLILNGVDEGTMILPWATGYHPFVSLSVPAGVQVNPGDKVAFSAPVGWASTAIGNAAGVDHLPVTNFTNADAFDDGKPITFRVGFNLSSFSYNINAFQIFFKNIVGRMNWTPYNWGSFSANLNNFSLAGNKGNNQIDSTAYPGTAGAWAIFMDSTTSTFSLSTTDTTYTTINEITSARNNGINGVGLGRVYDCQNIPGSALSDIGVYFNINDPSGIPKYTNMWICMPEDFNYTPGKPVVLDRTDPFALSVHFTRTTPPNTGSMRFVDPSNLANLYHALPFPPLPLQSYQGHGANSGWPRFWNYTNVAPPDTVARPYVYHPNFPPYTATLASSITATQTVIIITGDVIIPGTELTIDQEVMRVISISGTSITVNRGSNLTDATPHNAGTISVAGRSLLTSHLSNGLIVEFTTDRQFGLISGNIIPLAGTWPVITFTNGDTIQFQNKGCWAFVTGPTTFAGIYASSTSGNFYPIQNYSLSAATTNDQIWPSNVPYESDGEIIRKYNGCDWHVNIPCDASKDMVITIMEQVFSKAPSDINIYVETGNEPWNWQFGFFTYWTTIWNHMVPSSVQGAFQLKPYAYQTKINADVARGVFNRHGRNRGNQIYMMFNSQLLSGQGSDYLNFLQINGWTQYNVAIGEAPYFDLEPTLYNSTVANSYTNAQIADMFAHDVTYNPKSLGGPSMKATQDYIDIYNRIPGAHCIHIGYEGGASQLVPVGNGFLQSNARCRDTIYDPNYYWAERACLRLFGKYMHRLHIYNKGMYYGPNNEVWGVNHWIGQKPGYGDGRNGGSINRNFITQTGQPNTKPANVNQDLSCDSVRQQAINDWLREVEGNAYGRIPR